VRYEHDLHIVTCLTGVCRYSVGCIATNSREARFSIGPSQCYIKATEKLVSLSPRPSAIEVSRRQSLEAEEISPRRDPSQ
jgi:hypothetical protein